MVQIKMLGQGHVSYCQYRGYQGTIKGLGFRYWGFGFRVQQAGLPRGFSRVDIGVPLVILV